MKKIADRHLPFPRILHPWPEKRFLVTIQCGSPVRAQRPPGSVRGAERDLRPYRDLRVGKGFSSRTQHWSVRPYVRPFSAVHVTAGHNALRGSGPDQ